VKWLMTAGVAVALGGAGALAAGDTTGAQPVQLFVSSSPFVTSTTVPASVCFVTITADGGHGGAGTASAGGLAQRSAVASP